MVRLAAKNGFGKSNQNPTSRAGNRPLEIRARLAERLIIKRF